MTNVEEQKIIFWELFDEILKERGEPFKISYIHNVTKEITFYAAVNRKSSFNANAVDLTLSFADKKLRIDLFVSSPILMKKFLDIKEDIDEMISLPIDWNDGKRVLRPSIYLDFIPEDVEDYRCVIEESLPIISEFIEVAKKFGGEEFFD